METQQSKIDNAPLFTQPWVISLAFGVSLWAALPFLTIWPLAYVAILLLIWLTRRERLPQRYYLQVWIGCFAHWLFACWFATRPHWAGYIGWVFMAAYLSIYYVMFVGISRLLLARFKSLELLIYPTVWISLEWLRGRMITGYSMASLSHTHYEIPVFIQVSDLFGGYTLSFIIVFAASCLTLLMASKAFKLKLLYGSMGAFTVAATCLYGVYRLSETPSPDHDPLKVALIQGSMDTVFPWTEELQQQSLAQYRNLTIAARKKQKDIDLLVWPESAFPIPLDPETPKDKRIPDPIDFTRWYMAFIGSASLPGDTPDTTYFPNSVPLLTGIATRSESKSSMYNSATLIQSNGDVSTTYHKMHRVMFGEYIPFGEAFPILYELAPIPRGILAGEKPELIKVKGYGICPNICFESTVPHLIRHQIKQLEQNGKKVDLIANISNDGWFWGSNCLDQHLASNVFRSVENRKPTIAVVNTGFSAHIDGNGVILKKGGRQTPEFLLADVYRDDRDSIYQTVGDIPITIVALTVFLATLYCFFTRKTTTR